MENYSNKSILILGASELQLPAILSSKSKGIRTVVVDYDSKATGAGYADKFYNVSTLDYEGVLEVAKTERVDGIMTICSDRPMKIISKVGKELGLNTISEKTAYLATNKASMREVLKEHGVPVPKFCIVKSYIEFINESKKFAFPFVVKPSDNSGSRGITLVKNKNEAISAYEYAKENASDDVVLIEEYMVGEEVSVEIFVVDNTPFVIQITDKITTGPPHFVETGHTQPSSLCEDVQKQIRITAIDSVKALGINMGAAHVEIKITKDGPKIVELGARLGGDYITTDLIPLSTGFDMVMASVNSALGEKVQINHPLNRASAIRYFQFENHVNLSNKVISNLERLYINKLDVNEIKSSRDREAFFIVSADNLSELNNKISVIEKEIL